MKNIVLLAAALASLASLTSAKSSTTKTTLDTCKKTSTTSKRCTTTTTLILTSTTTITTGPITLYTSVIRGSWYVEVSTLTPTDGTATATVPPETTVTTVPGTSTLTYATAPTTTVGSPSTITAPPPAGFLPVQRTLKNATYNFAQVCKVRTTTTLYTDERFVPSTVTTTYYQPTYIIDGTSTYTNPTDFTSFSIVYTSTTYVVTDYSSTVTTATPYGTTATVTAGTTTVPGQCATTNFADAIVVDHGHSTLDIWFPYLTHDQTVEIVNDFSGPYGCCLLAFEQDAAAWGYRADLGCFFVNNVDPAGCTPAKTSFGAEFGPIDQSANITIGNGKCGRWTKPIYSAGP